MLKRKDMFCFVFLFLNKLWRYGHGLSNVLAQPGVVPYYRLNEWQVCVLPVLTLQSSVLFLLYSRLLAVSLSRNMHNINLTWLDFSQARVARALNPKTRPEMCGPFGLEKLQSEPSEGVYCGGVSLARLSIGSIGSIGHSNLLTWIRTQISTYAMCQYSEYNT